jgi:hypothetical protein
MSDHWNRMFGIADGTELDAHVGADGIGYAVSVADTIAGDLPTQLATEAGREAIRQAANRGKYALSRLAATSDDAVRTTLIRTIGVFSDLQEEVERADGGELSARRLDSLYHGCDEVRRYCAELRVPRAGAAAVGPR